MTIKTYDNRFRKNENRGLVVLGQARLDTPGVLHQVIVRGIEQIQIVTDEDRKKLVNWMGRLFPGGRDVRYP